MNDPAGVASPVYQTDTSGATWCACPTCASAVPVNAGRARHFPGLNSGAPPTLPFYRFALEALENAKAVLDAGSGSGAGSRILRERFDRVVGVDTNASAVDFAATHTPGVAFHAADLSTLDDLGHLDAAVVVDVLAHVASPYDVLRGLHRRLASNAQVLVAEAMAHPGQWLRSPARRAFSRRALASVLGAAGFEVETWLLEQGTFVSCIARRIEDAGADALALGNTLMRTGDGPAALAAFAEASKSTVIEVNLEATLASADLHFALGNGDASSQAFFRARELDPGDSRALAGLAQIALAIGQPQDAYALATMGLRLDPADTGCACAVALALERMEQPEAYFAWRTAASLAPDVLPVVARFAESASARGEHIAAVLGLERLRSYGDELGEDFSLTYAGVLARAGQRSDAVLELRGALLRNPENAALREMYESLA